MITKPKFDESVFVCPGAAIVGDVTLGKNVNVWYNAVLRGDDGAIKVGDNTNIQDCAVLHEETTVGSGCTIGHGAIVHGCTVGDNVLIGMGATVLNGAKIGDNCIVGAGALVTGKNGRSRRLHDPGQPRQGGPSPDGGRDREQPGIRPGILSSGRPVPRGLICAKNRENAEEAPEFHASFGACRLQPNRCTHILAPILNDYFSIKELFI